MDSIHHKTMNNIIEQYLLLVEKISNTTKASKTYGTDVDIYRTEIHVIQLIGDRSEIHISEISRLIGVTKGTVSQIGKRLENKGLVEKFVDPANRTRQLLRLTAKGKQAYQGHEHYHKQKHQEMTSFLQGLSDENAETLRNFLSIASKMIDDHS